MESTQSDADETTAASGRYGTDQAEATTNTRHSRKRWKLASECGECGQPLEEWEAGFCEGCYLQENNGQKICRSALLD